MHYYLATKQQKINLVTMTTASKIYTMVYKMVIFDENNKSIQIKRFLRKSTRVPHAKFYICKKVIFFENFDYRATLRQYQCHIVCHRSANLNCCKLSKFP